MAQNEMNLLFQQMGEVLTGVRALHDMIDLRQAQSEQLHTLLRTDLATLRRDQRELEEKFECVVSIFQHEMESLRGVATDNARSMAEVIGAVDALRQPVTDILGLKSRVAGLVFGAGVFGSAALWLAEPIYRWLLNEGLSRR